MPPQVSIKGLSALRRRLAELGPEIEREVVATVRESAREVQLDTRAHVAVDTGRAREGVTVRYLAGGLVAQVGWFDPDLYYIQFPEHGTSSQPARPSLRPAAERERPRLAKRLAGNLARVLR